MLLAIDTATRQAGLALYDPSQGRILGEEAWQSMELHTVELMPRLAHMMEAQGFTPSDLSGLVVSLGPGSFTGLRVALSVAKGLALACKLPLVGIPTLDVAARPHMVQPLPIWAVLQAGRGRICAANYFRQRGKWRQRGSYQLTTVEKLCSLVDKPAFFCGELEACDLQLLRDRLGPDVVTATPAASLRRAAFLAELGWERLAHGEADDPVSLAPIYLHLPKVDAPSQPSADV